MNIKLHASMMLAVCTVTGLALGGFLANRYWRIEERLREIEPASATMRRVESLGESVDEWLKVNDLVLHKQQGFMIKSSIRQATRLRLVVDEIAASALATDQGSETDALLAQINGLSDLILSSRGHNGPDRSERLSELAKQADSAAADLLASAGRLESVLTRRADYRQEDLADQQHTLGMMALLAAFVYFVVIWVCWLWIVFRVVKPIEDLSAAAGAADHEERGFVLPQTGPEEVRCLTENISSFVRKLQDAKANTEEEVRQRTAELEQASQAKGQFIATMSHELRTPLNGIINMNELILDTKLDDEQAGFARTARNAAEALLALINDILDFSKIEAHKLELETLPFDLRALVDSAVAILAGVAESRRLELQAVIASDVPARVVGDPTRLRQVLINLLNNALKFTAEGSVSVVVSAVESSTTETLLRIEVRDTGIGIPEDRRGSLFRAFEQVDSSTTRKFGGTGLGLAICRELVGLMGGEIDVDSVVGVGSTFWLTVRVGNVPDPVPAPAEFAEHGVVVVSRREQLRERVLAQLRFLGVPAEQVVGVADARELSVPDGERWLALVDPYGRGEHASGEVRDVRACDGVASDRLAVLDHWMRHWTADMGDRPRDIVRIGEPTAHEQLRGWLSGEAEQDDGRATSADESAVCDREAESEPGAVGGNADGEPPRGRVLVAEDNPVNQRVVTSLLQRERFEVVVTEDGQQAVERFAEDRFDLVLMDCQMPVMDGLEATRRMRAHEFERTASSARPRRVPIIALTANAEEGFDQSCFDAGMDRFLAKPCRRDKLVNAMRELLPHCWQEQQADAAPRRVLVADDSAINQKVAQTVLGRAGYQLVLVEDGRQAVEAVQREPFALVLMDCQMPVMDGLEASREIRALERENGLAEGTPDHLPIIALTGNSSNDDRADVLAAGMDRHVSKPFRPTELLSVVAEYAGRARSS